MKDLSYAELEKAPSRVKFLYMMAIMKQPVGSKMIEEAIKDHPEYFPDELEHRRKWASIPQSVHDEYWEEWQKLDKEVYKDLPPSNGIIGWLDDREGYENWNKVRKRCYDAGQPLFKALHQKYYGQYGIEYNGW